MLGHAGRDDLDLTEVTGSSTARSGSRRTLHWDVLALYAGAVDGIRTAARAAGRLDGIGVDSWAVDYGLLDRSGELLGNPVHYRDHRTDGVMDKVVADLGADFLYERTGLQLLPFNTIYQLASARGTAPLQVADRLLMIPDLVGFWLTGQSTGEVTNASTTGLLDIRTRRWSAEICDRLGVDVSLLPALQEPGTQVGTLLAEEHHVAATAPVAVWAVGSHDTASAVVGVPARSERFAYISCGTWSLVGLELDHPVLTEDSRRANFTNELGVDGTVRYLRNVMGLWLLQESLRTWEADGVAVPLDRLLREAADVPAMSRLIDPDDPDLLPPGTCRRASPTPVAGAGSRRRRHRPRRSAASSTAWRWPTAAPCAGPRSCPAGRSTSSTWSGAAPGTSCCASSPPTPAACRWWRARSRPRPSATSWSRRAPSARSRPSSPGCATCCGARTSCGATNPAVPPRRGTTPNGGCTPTTTEREGCSCPPHLSPTRSASTPWCSSGTPHPASLAHAVDLTVRTGFDLLEISLHDATNLDAAAARRQLEAAGRQVACSRGLSFDADISSDDPAVVARGEALLQDSLAATHALGGTLLTGALYSALGKYSAPLTRAGRGSVVEPCCATSPRTPRCTM